MQNINLLPPQVDVLPEYLVPILRTAIKTAFMRYFLDFTHASQKEAYEQLQARLELEQNDMTRKRSRATTNEVWAKQEIETRTAVRILAAVHRLQFHFRESSRIRKVCRIQRWYRWWRRLIPVNNIEDITLYKGSGRTEGLERHGLLRRGGVPITCAITQDSIPVKNSFKLVGPAGVVYAYTCSDLIRYVRSTHKFECPATRNKLGVIDVWRLQKRATTLGVNSGKNLVREYADRENTHNESVENGYALTGLESSATEMFDRAVHICERGNITEDLHFRLEGDILPEWREYVRQLYDLDTEACSAMLRTEEARVNHLMTRGRVEQYAGYLYLQEQLKEWLDACSLRMRNTQPRRVFRTADNVLRNRQQNQQNRIRINDRIDELMATIIGEPPMPSNIMNLELDQWLENRTWFANMVLPTINISYPADAVVSPPVAPTITPIPTIRIPIVAPNAPPRRSRRLQNR